MTADGPQTSAIAEFGVSGTSTPPSSPPPSTPPPSLPPPSPTYASLAANRTSPQPAGTTVTFSAGASGGASPYSYKWWVKLNGGAWTLLQDWSTSTTLAWTPNASGTYAIGIWARSNGVTADSPQTSAIAEFVVSAPSAVAATTVAVALREPADIRVDRCGPAGPATHGDGTHLLGQRVRRCQPLLLQVVGEEGRRPMDRAAGFQHERDPDLDADDVGHLRDRDLGAEQRRDGGYAADVGRSWSSRSRPRSGELGSDHRSIALREPDTALTAQIPLPIVP